MATMSEYQQEPGGYVDAGGHRVIPVDPAEVERVVQEFRSKVGTQPAVGAEFHKVSEERFMSVDAKRNGNGNVTSDVDEFYASRQGYPGSGAGAEADDYMGMRASAFSQSYGPGTTFVSGPYVPCDVFPNKVAVVHDIWSGCNFCTQVQEMLESQAKDHPNKYFARGTCAPKPNK